jgi:hypothetical protein
MIDSSCSRVLVASVINAVRVKKKRVSRRDQCEVCDVGGIRSLLTVMHRKITASIRMLFRNFQSQGQGLHHAALINGEKFAKL